MSSRSSRVQLLRELIGDQDVIVADGFTPMQKTTGATTHMFDSLPDIHPKAIGYDLLPGALVNSLP
jgi:hypothetical protein